MIYYAIVWLSGVASGVLLFGWFATWRTIRLEAELETARAEIEEYRHELGL